MRTVDTSPPTITDQDLGKGWDTFATSDKTQNIITGGHSGTPDKNNLVIRFCETTESLKSTLEISTSISANYDFVESLTGKGKYFQELAVTTHSLCVVVYAVNAERIQLDNPQLIAGVEPPTPETALDFYLTYGDSFINELQIGGVYIATYVFYSQTVQEKTELIASLNTNLIYDGGKLSTDFSTKLAKVTESTTTRWRFHDYVRGYEGLPLDIYEAATQVHDKLPDKKIVMDLAVRGYEEALGVKRSAIQGIIDNRETFTGQGDASKGFLTLRNNLYTLQNQIKAMQAIRTIYKVQVPGYENFVQKGDQVDSDIQTIFTYINKLTANPVAFIAPPTRQEMRSLSYGTPRFDVAEMPITDLISWGGHNNQPWADVLWTDYVHKKRLYSLQFYGSNECLSAIVSVYRDDNGISKDVLQHGTSKGTSSFELILDEHGDPPVRFTVHLWKRSVWFSSQVIVTKVRFEFANGRLIEFPTKDVPTDAVKTYDFTEVGRENQAFLGFQGFAKDYLNLLTLIIVRFNGVIWEVQ